MNTAHHNENRPASRWSRTRARVVAWLPDADDPFRRTSRLYLITVGLVASYIFVSLATGDQPVGLRVAGALSMGLLMVVWTCVHGDDRDLLWLTPFEALGVFTIGLGVGGLLKIMGLVYVALYFRALRGGIGRGLLRALALAGSLLAVQFMSPSTSVSGADLLLNTTFAIPMVAVTNAILGKGLRRSGRDQEALASAHQEIERSHRRLSEAERLAGFGSWEWESGSGAIEISEGLRAIGAFDGAFLTPDDWLSRVHPEDRSRAREAISRLIGGVDKTSIGEYRMVRPDGEVRHVMTRGRRLLDESGSFSGGMGTIQDITEYRELVFELARHQELSEMKSRFLSTVSHELRTPLTSLVGFTDAMLADEFDRPTRLEFLTLMHQQGGELAALIEDLITFGRVEAGELTLSPKEVVLRHEIESVVGALGSESADVRIDVSAEVVLWADPLRVRQIIRNLLDNALKYGATPVTFTAVVDARQAVCRVSDTGSGVDPADAEAIFEPYRRLVDDRTMSLPGVGLGLPLCRMLAERQHGSLRYAAGTSEPTFELILPTA